MVLVADAAETDDDDVVTFEGGIAVVSNSELNFNWANACLRKMIYLYLENSKQFCLVLM